MGIFASLMTWLWYNWNEDRKEKKAESEKVRQINRLRAQLGYVPLEVEEELIDRLIHDWDAMVDCVAGTLDRDSPEWMETYKKYKFCPEVVIDGRVYNRMDLLLYDFALKKYKVKVAPIHDPTLSSIAKFR